MQTYYLPAIARPLSFIRGLSCLFGDQTMFCRTSDFRAVRGFNPDLPIMEDLDLCIRLHEAGPLCTAPWPPLLFSPHSNSIDDSTASHAELQNNKTVASTRSSCRSVAPRPRSQLSSATTNCQPLCEDTQRHQTHCHISSFSIPAPAPQQRSKAVSVFLCKCTALLRSWARSHCKRRGTVRMVWQPVAKTSGRRLETWGNVKVLPL